MKESIRNKLEHLAHHLQLLEQQLARISISEQAEMYRETAREHASLLPLVSAWKAFCQAEQEYQDACELSEDVDAEVRAMAQQEVHDLSRRLEQKSAHIHLLLLPKDPYDDGNIFLEIRAGTGGSEAALFCADLLRMYTRYSESKGWNIELLNLSEGEMGGYREVISRVVGHGSYSRLKFESGVHRVQRVPVTESQGRVHTSACSVAVLPEIAATEVIELDPGDLRIDTFRSSGAGGQHVNKTDSAVRITHLPSGVVVECQQQRSQHQNKAKALEILKARLVSAQREQAVAEQSAQRKGMVGSGDRSERIRTYNFPQGRVTDHRISLTEYKLPLLMEGQIDILINPLIREHQAALMAGVGAA